MKQIRKAVREDLAPVCDFYRVLCADLEGRRWQPRWHWGSYPCEEDVMQAISRSELWIADWDGVIAGAMILNTRHNPAYEDFDWGNQLKAGNYLVVHTLGTAPCFARQGVARRLLQKARDEAQQMGYRAVRLDVLSGNVPAERLYPAEGFRLAGSMPMVYEDIGTVDTKLYEWTVPEYMPE